MASALDSRGHRRRAPLDLRAAFIGEEGFDALAIGADSSLVRPGESGRRGASLGERDVIVLDPMPPGFTRADVEAAIEAARAGGAAVIGIDGGSPPSAIWEGLADTRIGGGAGSVPYATPFDATALNPIGFPQKPIGRFAAIASAGAPGEALVPALRALRGAAGARVDLFGEPPPGDCELPDGVEHVKERLDGAGVAKRVAAYRGLLDGAALHGSPSSRAAAVVRAAAAGAPVALVDGSSSIRPFVGDALADALDSVDPRALSDVHARERASVAVRRAALRDHSLAGTWRRIGAALDRPLVRDTPVSVLLATRRSDFLAHAIEQVNRQSYGPRELVVVLHGDGFADDPSERLRSEVEGPLTIVRASDELTLGEALNRGVEAASAPLVAKMDDDDWYARDHLSDLVLAQRYSAAELVGKAPEFIYLADIGITIRRFASEAETPSRRVASGALLISREGLDATGGFAPVASREQIPLIEALEAAGGRIHRTHGFGYLVNRHGRGHTWDPEVDYFLVQSELQVRGRGFEAAGVD